MYKTILLKGDRRLRCEGKESYWSLFSVAEICTLRNELFHRIALT
jgi:hypothetical protein